MNVIYRSIAIATLIVAGLTSAGNSQPSVLFSADGGVSKTAGSEYDKWDWGWNAAGNLLFRLTDGAYFGIRGAYNRWDPNKATWLGFFDSLTNSTVKGTGSIIEIVPSLRFTTSPALSMVNFFIQGGAGVFIVKDLTTVRGIDEADSLVSRVFGQDNRAHFGFNVGPGLSIGSEYLSLELFPMYNQVFLEGHSIKYFTIDAGLCFGI